MHRLVSAPLNPIAKWFPSSRGRRSKPGPVYRKLTFEILEERTALSATPLSPLVMPLPVPHTTSPGIVFESTNPSIALPIMNAAPQTSLSTTASIGQTTTSTVGQTTTPSTSQQVSPPPPPSSPAAKSVALTPTPVTAIATPSLLTPVTPGLLTATELATPSGLVVPAIVPLITTAVAANQALIPAVNYQGPAVNNPNPATTLFGGLVPSTLVKYPDSPNPYLHGIRMEAPPGNEGGQGGGIMRKSMYRGQDQDGSEPNAVDGDDDLLKLKEGAPNLDDTAPDKALPDDDSTVPEEEEVQPAQ